MPRNRDQEFRDRGKVVELPSERQVRAFSLEKFLGLDIQPRETLLTPWLPSQGLVMVYAERGVGKTFFALSAAYAIASAGKFLKWDAPKARRVLYVDGEMPGAAMQERLASVVAASEKQPPEDFFRIITPDLQEIGIPDLSTLEGQAALEPHLAGVDLVVLDNLSTLCRSGEENAAESWGLVQEWALVLRRRGTSVKFVHHAGKSGQQRGTSRREDVLDTVIALRRPSDYCGADGCRFEVSFPKARGLHGDDLRPFEARLETRDGVAFWTFKGMEDRTTEQVADLHNQGFTQRQIGSEQGISKSAVNRHVKRARERGLLET